MRNRSAYQRCLELLADPSRQAVVYFGVTRHRSFRAVGRVGINRVTTAFAIQTTPLLLQMTDQLMPLQARRAPT
jgi:hypothetical protein